MPQDFYTKVAGVIKSNPDGISRITYITLKSRQDVAVNRQKSNEFNCFRDWTRDFHSELYVRSFHL
jgi:hypothetical protein